MDTVKIRVALAVVSAAVVLPAQDPEGVRAKMEAALAKQRSAAAAMQDSLARQRSSLEKQTGQSAGSGFFVLPRPAASGAAAPYSGADCKPLPISQVDSLVQKADKREDLDEAVLHGVMRQESGFRPCASAPPAKKP